MAVPRRILCEIAEIRDHGDRVYTLVLRPRQPLPAFRPGQFLHLALGDFDPSGFWPDSRVFSIASSPANRDQVLLCYSVKGAYTERMASELAAGRKVWIKLPYGEFTIGEAPAVVLLAGGTGITAFTAFLEDLVQRPARRVVLVYGARRPDLLVFHDRIRELAARCAGLQVAFLAEQPGADPRFDEGAGGPPPVSYRAGRLRIADLPACGVAPELAWEYYLSGPAAMIRDLSRDLGTAGVRAEQVHVDAWE